MAKLHQIIAPTLPTPRGHYCHGVRFGGLIFVSGQLPITSGGIPLNGAPFVDQARTALSNMIAVVAASGSDVRHISKITAYIVDVANWPEFDRVYGELMGNARPARTVVPVPELHYGCLVEVDAIATDL